MLAGLITALAAVVSDQASKALVFGFLAETQPVVAVTPFFNLVSAWNTGVRFSMFDNLGGAGVYILSAFSLVVVGFLLYWLSREKTLLMQVSLGMVIGGAIGNVIDRVRIGAVFDFLDVHFGGYHWPAFNLADSFICIGAVLIICDGLLVRKCDNTTTSFILLAAALFLSGCGLTKEDLGMAASKPDETQVTRRNQLVIPPDFDVRPQQ